MADLADDVAAIVGAHEPMDSRCGGCNYRYDRYSWDDVSDHLASVLLASFVLVPKPSPLTRQEARELYVRKVREITDDPVILARLDELQREEEAGG